MIGKEKSRPNLFQFPSLQTNPFTPNSNSFSSVPRPLSHMIAANSPLKYASPGPTLHPNPAGIRSRFPCFGLGSGSSQLSKPWVGRSRTKMWFLRRVSGGWSRIPNKDEPAEDNDATAEHLVIMVNGINGR